MEINIISANQFSSFWPIENFNEKYEEEGIKSSSIATIFDPAFPERTGMIILRTFIEKSKRAKTDQKYVIGLRFYSFGDMVTIDLISLDRDFHREICFDHLQRMNFPMWGEHMENVDHFAETTRAPFILAGGHLRVLDDNSVEFFGGSGDYTGKLLLSDSNSLASYISLVSGITSSEEIEPGKGFINHLLKFIFENKLKKEFYQNLIADLYLQKDEAFLNSQNIGALITMEVLDRHLAGNDNIIGLMVEEYTRGLASEVMLHSMARRIRTKK